MMSIKLNEGYSWNSVMCMPQKPHISSMLSAGKCGECQ